MTRSIRISLFSLLTLALMTAAAPVHAQGPMADPAPASDHHTIVDVAQKAGFNTLVQAAKAAGLAETLQSDGPFTVFAPTDEAFAELPDGTLESLLQPENRDQLRSILTYHVVPGEVTADEVMGLEMAETVNGAAVDVATRGGSVYINGAQVTKADVDASNGVIHVIDEVLMPPTGSN